jgi:RNA polymerase sigma-70 factor (ECF subfamily)
LLSVKFKCIDYLRTKKADRFISLDNIEDSALLSTNDLKDEDIEPLFCYFAAKLPPKTREVFLLSRKSGMTYKEIAEEIDISVKTVENQMGRALRILKVILKDQNLLLWLMLFKSLK